MPLARKFYANDCAWTPLIVKGAHIPMEFRTLFSLLGHAAPVMVEGGGTSCMKCGRAGSRAAAPSASVADGEKGNGWCLGLDDPTSLGAGFHLSAK